MTSLGNQICAYRIEANEVFAPFLAAQLLGNVVDYVTLLMSRLAVIFDWPACAQQAAYNASRLAQLISVSPSQLRRHFLRKFRQPTQYWLNHLRLQAACQRLLSGHSVKETAFELHYADAAHFCHHFKAHFGCTPSAWLLKSQEMAISPIRVTETKPEKPRNRAEPPEVTNGSKKQPSQFRYGKAAHHSL